LALGPVPGAARGAYRVQAELAAVHAVSRHADGTDWPAIVALYDELLTFTPSPVISLNRAIAVGMSNGPLAGLAALDAVAEDERLAGHYLVPAARGDLLAGAGLLVEAVQALELAARRAPTQPERQQLTRRVEELRSRGSTS
jgi:RNA polymerase sigma-70 factor (ECF subfamily)